MKTLLGKPTFVSKRLGRKSPVWRKPPGPANSVWFRGSFFDGPVIELGDGKPRGWRLSALPVKLTRGRGPDLSF